MPSDPRAPSPAPDEVTFAILSFEGPDPAADGVMANSGREPFGLVGLESMAAGAATQFSWDHVLNELMAKIAFLAARNREPGS